MDLKTLLAMLATVREKIADAFSKMLETASDEDVRKYEMLVKQSKELEEQIKEAEALEEKEKLEKEGEIPEGTNTPPKKKLSEREEFGKKLVEAVALGTKFTGLLPRDVADNIQRKKEALARVRGYCTVHQATGDYTVYIEGDAATVAYVGENAAIGETNPSVNPLALAAFKLGALVKVSREFIEDLGVDVMAYLEDVLAKAFAKKEDSEILFGAGTSSSKTAMRGVATGALSANTITAASSTTVTWDEVKKTIQALKAYRTNATLFCGQAFLDICHSFKDGDTYMFPQGQPITQIYGVRVVVSDTFPALASGAVAAVVGDFSYYHILDRQSLEITTLYELYAANDQVGIRAIERIDGDFVQEAFAVLKMKTESEG